MVGISLKSLLHPTNTLCIVTMNASTYAQIHVEGFTNGTHIHGYTVLYCKTTIKL